MSPSCLLCAPHKTTTRRQRAMCARRQRAQPHHTQSPLGINFRAGSSRPLSAMRARQPAGAGGSRAGCHIWVGALCGCAGALCGCAGGPADSVPAQQCPSHALLLTSSLALIGVLAAHRRVYVAPLVLAELILVGLALGAPGPASRQSRTQLPTNERVQQQGAPAMHSTVQPDTALAAAVA